LAMRLRTQPRDLTDDRGHPWCTSRSALPPIEESPVQVLETDPDLGVCPCSFHTSWYSPNATIVSPFTVFVHYWHPFPFLSFRTLLAVQWRPKLVPRSTLYVQLFYPAPPFVTVATDRKDMGPVER
jgi:hypothetical protein